MPTVATGGAADSFRAGTSCFPAALFMLAHARGSGKRPSGSRMAGFTSHRRYDHRQSDVKRVMIDNVSSTKSREIERVRVVTTAQTTELDVQPTPLALLLLGREADPKSERGVECPGDLPSPSDPDLVERARAAKEKLGDKVFVLGHHYQRDEVIQFADVTGDSFKLARDAAARPEAEYIVFCGVHFMAESADILTSRRPEGGAARPRRRLLDGRHGDGRAGRRVLGRADRGRHSRAGRARLVHELLRGHQGVHGQARRHDLHLVQRRAGP